MSTINVAIIGQGRSGRDIHGAYFHSDRNTHFKVVAVVDALEERRIRAKEEYGCDVYASYQELFERKDIDLVINSTFSHLHAPVSIDLLEHGFNVICEKPFAKTYEDGCRVIKAAKKNGKMLNVFQQSRLAPYYREIRRILDSGALGEIAQINIRFNGFARRWDWQTSKAYAGGGVRNTGPHPLDQAMDLLGFPENVNVFSKLGRYNVSGDADDYAKIILTVPGKPLIDVEISSCDAYSPYTYKVMAKNGSLRATMKQIEYKYFIPENEPPRPLVMEPLFTENRTPAYCSEKLTWHEETVEVAGNAFDIAVSNYYNMIYLALAENRPMEITPEQVLTQLKVIDLIHAQNPLTVD